MGHILTVVVTSLFLLSLIAVYPVNSAFAGKEKKAGKSNKKLVDRIDFGNSYIMGQSIKSGAVYLMQRKQSEIKSMLDYRKDYREEIFENFKIGKEKK